MIRIEDYIPIVGQATVEELGLLANRLRGKAIQNINSTAVGGGGAEILSRMIPLLNQLGVSGRWGGINMRILLKGTVITRTSFNSAMSYSFTIPSQSHWWKSGRV